MISGVTIKPLLVHPDIPDRPDEHGSGGFLMEVLRSDEGLLRQFGQSTFTVAPKQTIKAFHYHEHQDDLWFVATGRAKVVLYDRRPESPTKGETQVFYAGQGDYKLIVIPAGVAHGYQVMSQEPVLLFYHTTAPYQSADPDEQRIPWNDPAIGFDWGGGA